jgi:hypothetical protein
MKSFLEILISIFTFLIAFYVFILMFEAQNLQIRENEQWHAPNLEFKCLENNSTEETP